MVLVEAVGRSRELFNSKADERLERAVNDMAAELPKDLLTLGFVATYQSMSMPFHNFEQKKKKLPLQQFQSPLHAEQIYCLLEAVELQSFRAIGRKVA